MPSPKKRQRVRVLHHIHTEYKRLQQPKDPAASIASVNRLMKPITPSTHLLTNSSMLALPAPDTLSTESGESKIEPKPIDTKTQQTVEEILDSLNDKK